MAPSEYFKRQVFVSVERNEAGVKYVILHRHGSEKDWIARKTDYPTHRTVTAASVTSPSR